MSRTSPPPEVQCRFYRKHPTESGHHYEPIRIDTWHGDGALHTAHPPAVGDRITLTDASTNTSAVYLVEDRSWSHASYRSQTWPSGQVYASTGPQLDVIVSAASGLFADEAPA